MVTDIHCHFIPDAAFRYVLGHGEFDTAVTAEDDDRIDLIVRGMHFGLNRSFFDPAHGCVRN
jgi:hypothetical protein